MRASIWIVLMAANASYVVGMKRSRHVTFEGLDDSVAEMERESSPAPSRRLHRSRTMGTRSSPVEAIIMPKAGQTIFTNRPFDLSVRFFAPPSNPHGTNWAVFGDLANEAMEVTLVYDQGSSTESVYHERLRVPEDWRTRSRIRNLGRITIPGFKTYPNAWPSGDGSGYFLEICVRGECTKTGPLKLHNSQHGEARFKHKGKLYVHEVLSPKFTDVIKVKRHHIENNIPVRCEVEASSRSLTMYLYKLNWYNKYLPVPLWTRTQATFELDRDQRTKRTFNLPLRDNIESGSDYYIEIYLSRLGITGFWEPSTLVYRTAHFSIERHH